MRSTGREWQEVGKQEGSQKECVFMHFIVGNWAANLLGSSRRQWELAAGSPHPMGEGAGLLPALGWGLLWGLWTLPACSAHGQPRISVCSPKPCDWHAAVTLGRAADRGGVLRRNVHQGPSGVGRLVPPERHGGAGSTGRGRLTYTPFLSRLGIWSGSPQGSVQLGCERVERYHKWESLNELWRYSYPRFMRTFISVPECIWKQMFYNTLFPFLF